MNANTEIEVVIEVSERDLERALSTGLVMPHPQRDGIIVWGPGKYSSLISSESDDVVLCITTKHTRDDIESTPITYRTSDDDYNITFDLNDDKEDV